MACDYKLRVELPAGVKGDRGPEQISVVAADNGRLRGLAAQKAFLPAFRFLGTDRPLA